MYHVANVFAQLTNNAKNYQENFFYSTTLFGVFLFFT